MIFYIVTAAVGTMQIVVWLIYDDIDIDMVAWRRNGRVSDLQSRGPGFDFRSGGFQVVTTWMGDCLRTGKVHPGT